jgi:hypothetical protein
MVLKPELRPANIGCIVFLGKTTDFHTYVNWQEGIIILTPHTPPT